MAERDYIFIAALRLKTNDAELVCCDRAKTCWWSWRTTPWTWLTLWAKLCSTLNPLAASVCGVLAETTAGQCPSTQVQIGTGLQPGSLVSATREVTDGPLLLIGELESSSIAVDVATDMSPSFSFFFFFVAWLRGLAFFGVCPDKHNLLLHERVCCTLLPSPGELGALQTKECRFLCDF